MADSLRRGLAREHGIRFCVAEVSAAAAELERRHLAGPVAGQILAQTLCGAALLSADVSAPQECISLQLRVDGPVDGVLVEASGDGKLRGFTYAKILNDLDGTEPYDLDTALGGDGGLTVIRSTPTATVSTAHIRARPPAVAVNIARYFGESMQTPTAVELAVASKDGYLYKAVGCTAEKMPDGDTGTFVKVLEAFDDKRVRTMLLAANDPAAALTELLGIGAIEFTETRVLAFGCRCDTARAEAILSSLSNDELQEAITSGKPETVTCHFCGHSYTVDTAGLKQVLSRKLEAN